MEYYSALKRKEIQPGAVAVILATWEEEIERIVVGGQQGQKVLKTPSEPIKSGCGGSSLSYQLPRKCK
jgi:hypothetical protein